MNDILRHSILTLSDTRRSALIQRAELLEYNRAGYKAQVAELEEEVAAIDREFNAIDKELHRLHVIDTELEPTYEDV
jgi:vacuolar-type H+-ATPase subunit I/STV1